MVYCLAAAADRMGTMTYKGHVENGMVVFDEPAPLADGTQVRIEVEQAAEAYAVDQTRRVTSLGLYQDLMECAGKATDLPEDVSENLDHYLYGHPKR
jgi:hypothetical protein